MIVSEGAAGETIKGNREKYTIATKFGIQFVDGQQQISGDPAYVRSCAEDSLKRLQTSYIDLYGPQLLAGRSPCTL